MKDELEIAKAHLIAFVTSAVNHLLDIDSKIPLDVTDHATLMLIVPPCPKCGQSITQGFGSPIKDRIQEELFRAVLAEMVPSRWHPVLRAMMVHLDHCKGMAPA